REGSGGDIFLECDRFALALFDLAFDHIADRDDADKLAAVDHGNVADAMPGHLLHELGNRCAAGGGDDRFGHEIAHGTGSEAGPVLAQTTDHIALAEDAGHAGAIDHNYGADAVGVELFDRLGNRRPGGDGNHGPALGL